MENRMRSLVDFLNNLRDFCVPSNNTDKLWEEFAQVKQTANGRSRPIQEVATELITLQMRVPELSSTQLYYQFKNAMDQDLHTLVTPHINKDMHWTDIVDMAMKFDEGRRRRNQKFIPTGKYQQNRSSNFKSYGQNKTWNTNNKPWNNNNKPWNNNKPRKDWNKNKEWKPRTTYQNNRSDGKDLSKVKCFNCNEMGHYASNCTKKSVRSAAQSVRFRPTYQKKPQIRTAATRIKIPKNQPNGLIDGTSKHMLINIKVNGHPARALIDQQTTGASLISTTFASTYNILTVVLEEEITISLAL